MSVLCGTDFSERSNHAVRVAAAFARALGEPLVIAHVVDSGAIGFAADSVAMECANAASRALGAQASQHVPPALEVSTEVRVGVPDLELAMIARERSASLMVIGVLGHRASGSARVGSLAVRLAQAAPVPVLLVGDAACFEACASGSRPLRVLVGADFTFSSSAAVEWLPHLLRLGPCTVVLQHLYDPVGERRRLGLRGSSPAGAADPDVERMLLQELRTRAGGSLPPSGAEIRVTAWPSWVAEGLVEVAASERFDLIAVGGRQRVGLEAIRHDSVSERLLRLGTTAVLRVPVESAGERPLAFARYAQILVTTDLSPLANAAIPHAYSLAAPGGTVHLLHVTETPGVPNPLYAHYERRAAPDPDVRVAHEREIESRLRALIPEEAERRGMQTRIEVARATEAGSAEAIRSVAERLGVDAICMATHGRSGLSRLVAGSVASDVAAASTRPVILVRPAVEA